MVHVFFKIKFELLTNQRQTRN